MTTLEHGGPEILKLKKLAQAKRFDELEAAWIAAAESGDMSTEDVMIVLGVLVRQKETATAETLAWCLLSAWSERKGAPATLVAAKRIATALEGGSIRSETAELCRKVYAELPNRDTLIDMTVLREATPLAEALAEMELMAALPPGSFVRDRNLSAPGQVVGLDPERKALIVNIGGQERRYEGQSLGRLSAMAADDFKALLIFDRPRLAAVAAEDPERFTMLILREFGPALKFRELKAHVAEIIGESAWSSWWSEAKLRISRSPMIDMSSSSQPTFELRNRPISHAQYIRHQLDTAGNLDEKCARVFDYARELSAGAEADGEVVAFLDTELARAAGESKEGYVKVAVEAAREELARASGRALAAPAVKLAEVIAGQSDLSVMMTPATNDEVARCALSWARGQLGENWKPFFADILPGSPAAVCEWLAQELLAAGEGHRLAVSAEAVVGSPDRYPRAALWLWKAVTGSPKAAFAERIDGAAALNAVLAAAAVVKRTPPFADGEYVKKVAAMIRGALSAGKFEPVRVVLEDTSAERVGCLREVVQRNPGLTEILRNDLLRVFHHAHPKLFVKEVPAWQEDAIYTTAEAFGRQQEAFAHLVNVKIAENAKAIGEAAARGDLSENAEFTAALEERDRLTERATRMREELTKARILEPGSVRTDHVTIGTRVRAENVQSGQVEDFTFLGPWDAEPDRRVFSYQARLSQAFMGRKVGEVVEFSAEGTNLNWKIAEIEAVV